MGMDREIRLYPEQMAFEPEIVNQDKFQSKSLVAVCGMGGSNLASSIIRSLMPNVQMVTHRDYGLPPISEDQMENTLFVLSSYSGNTEEVLDAYRLAKEKGYAMASIAIGGTLLETAQKDGTPHIQMPDLKIQPRSGAILSFLSIAKLMGLDHLISDVHKLGKKLDVELLSAEGKRLADSWKDKVPVFYSTQRFMSVARIAKIKMNETAKIPSFFNVFPEHNHNEVNGYDVQDASRHLSEKFHFVMLQDESDHPRNKKRMEVVKKLMEDRGMTGEIVNFEGGSLLDKIFGMLTIMEWAAFYTGSYYGHETAEVPLVEEFKTLID